MSAEQPDKAGNSLAAAALNALRRAARQARETARMTGTAIVISRDGEVVRIEASALPEESVDGHKGGGK